MGDSVIRGNNISARYVEYLCWLAAEVVRRPRPAGEQAMPDERIQSDTLGSAALDDAEAKLAAWLRDNVAGISSNPLERERRGRAGEQISLYRTVVEAPDSRTSQDRKSELSSQQLRTLNRELLTLTAALDQLPLEQRTLLLTKLLTRNSIAEISEQTGRSKLAVVSLLYKAMKSLRSLIAANDPPANASDEHEGRRGPE
jgi:DNA-directed RNA polymerase specialized sigma24 family protein